MGNFHAKRKEGQKFIIKHKKNYKGIPTMQADGYTKAFEKFLADEKFNRIIELGTRSGGLTLFLSDISGVVVYSFEKFDNFITKDTIKQLENNNAKLYFQDVFKSIDIPKIINNEGRVLLLCDNGDKIKEASLFTPYLKTDDVIMAHDYFPRISDYHSQNTWKSCEIMDTHINYNAVDKYYPYYDDFKKVFWVCLIRR